MQYNQLAESVASAVSNHFEQFALPSSKTQSNQKSNAQREVKKKPTDSQEENKLLKAILQKPEFLDTDKILTFEAAISSQFSQIEHGNKAVNSLQEINNGMSEMKKCILNEIMDCSPNTFSLLLTHLIESKQQIDLTDELKDLLLKSNNSEPSYTASQIQSLKNYYTNWLTSGEHAAHIKLYLSLLLRGLNKKDGAPHGIIILEKQDDGTFKYFGDFKTINPSPDINNPNHWAIICVDKTGKYYSFKRPTTVEGIMNQAPSVPEEEIAGPGGQVPTSPGKKLRDLANRIALGAKMGRSLIKVKATKTAGAIFNKIKAADNILKSLEDSIARKQEISELEKTRKLLEKHNLANQQILEDINTKMAKHTAPKINSVKNTTTEEPIFVLYDTDDESPLVKKKNQSKKLDKKEIYEEEILPEKEQPEKDVLAIRREKSAIHEQWKNALVLNNNLHKQLDIAEKLNNKQDVKKLKKQIAELDQQIEIFANRTEELDQAESKAEKAMRMTQQKKAA